MSHPNTCGHCGNDYDRNDDHTCDIATAFDRITDLENALENAIGETHRLDTVLRHLCEIVGLSDKDISRLFQDP